MSKLLLFSDTTVELIDATPRRGFLSGCNPQSEIYNLKSFAGVLAQLVERLNGIEEVTGSNPVGSIFCLASSRDNTTSYLTRHFHHRSIESPNALSFALLYIAGVFPSNGCAKQFGKGTDA